MSDAQLYKTLPAGWTLADFDFYEGLRDGRDPTAPEPSVNRSHCYRHSFGVGRAELAGRPIEAEVSRSVAAIAEAKDRRVRDGERVS